MTRGVVLLGLFLFVALEGYAGDAPWLGSDKASNIPRHERVESELLTSAFTGLQHEGVYQELLEYMKTQCVRDSGVSLVNVVMMRAIGEVEMPSGNGGQAT